MSELLKIQNLSTGYGRKTVLENINLSIDSGEVISIIGQNGCGKSTLLKTIFNLIPLHTGTVYYKDKNISNLLPDEIKKNGISYFMQKDSIFAQLTINENLKLAMNGNNKIIKNQLIEEVFTLFPILAGKQKKIAGNLSGGERQMLSMAMLMVQNNKVWLMDEPTAGLDEKNVENMAEMIAKIQKQKNISILLVEHNYKVAFSLASQVCIIKNLTISEKYGEQVFNSNDFLDKYLYN